MPRKAKELKPTALNTLRPGRHAVGGVPGLLLQVGTSDGDGQPASGRSSWLLQAMVAGRRRQIGLGPYPEVKLADAREKARQLRQAIRDGRDPLAEKVAARSAIQAAAAKAVTFRKAAELYIETNRAAWRSAKHAEQWTSTLSTYAYPVFGDKHVADVTKGDVLAVVGPLWQTKNETASRLRGRIEAVLKLAMQREHRPEGVNPAALAGLGLPRASKVATVKHHAALAIDQMHDFMQRLRAAEGQGARALEFAILTAARSGEVRGATWAEVDLDAALWVIPKQRMKADREHRVPLSTAALELLQAQGPGEPDALLFAGAKGKPLSDMTLTAALRRMQVDVTAHGFRSTFRDWVAERTAYPQEVAEMALAHAVGDKVEAAYRRGDLFDKRRGLMEAWAQFVVTPPATGKVVPIGTKAA